MNLVQQYNFHRGYFIPDFNMKPRKKTTRMKNSVQWGVKCKRIYNLLVIDSRRELEYRMIRSYDLSWI